MLHQLLASLLHSALGVNALVPAVWPALLPGVTVSSGIVAWVAGCLLVPPNFSNSSVFLGLWRNPLLRSESQFRIPMCSPWVAPTLAGRSVLTLPGSMVQVFWCPVTFLLTSALESHLAYSRFCVCLDLLTALTSFAALLPSTMPVRIHIYCGRLVLLFLSVRFCGH